MKDINEVVFGHYYNEKYRRFTAELNIINSKFEHYFNSRKSKISHEEKDCLAYHYWMVNQFGTLTFGFLPESDIDEKIKRECVNLFDKIFHDKSGLNSH